MLISVACDCQNGQDYKDIFNWDEAKYCPFCGKEIIKLDNSMGV
jgi:hypothetical protein